VVVYDRYGEGARRAAAFLRAHGVPNVAALEGGLDEYARWIDPAIGRLGPSDRLEEIVVVQLPRPETGCLAYLLGDPSERRAILVDPGIDPSPYRARLKDGGWTLSAIVETHTHADHLAGHGPLHAATGAPIYVSHRSPASYPHERLSEGSTVEAGALALVARETPGHTQDHLTLRLGHRVFTGDTLLIGTCGRTDLGGGSPDLLWESFRNVYDRLPSETEIYPAHFGPKHALPARYVSSLGFERATNEALRIASREDFVRYMTEGWPPKPDGFERIVAANLAAFPAPR